MNTQAGLGTKILEMAERIRELRIIQNLDKNQMAERIGVTKEEYTECEAGRENMSFAFLYSCASALGVDVTDIIEGASPRLSKYSLTRRGAGQYVDKAHGMEYYNMAAMFKNRICEPLEVHSAYDPDATEIELTTHDGQECDIVLSGVLKVQVGEHVELLGAGDVIYYDSSTPHGMCAAGGGEAVFYAIVLTPQQESGKRAVIGVTEPQPDKKPRRRKPYAERRVWEDFIVPEEDEGGALRSISFKNEDRFNFAFDVVDAMARRKPSKLAMLHVDKHMTERYFTFGDVSRYSSRAANYFASLGVKKGDRVMLILKRHYQFWFSILGLHKIGAIVIPASNQLLAHDLEYRFNSAGVSAIVCTPDDGVPEQVELAAAKCPGLKTKIIVGGPREGWHDFDDEFRRFGDDFTRPAGGSDPCGDELMLMFFTSGTTGYPKIAAHSFKYPLGHFVTARYWHQVNPEGLHLTISDTGWAKALWGKLYGQWLCEAAIFVYDFDRFKAEEILPMFAKYNITTFCAPPTMYRFLIKEDLARYDLSSIEHATIAGEALNPEVFNQFKKATGLSVMEGFGQSETTVMIGNLLGMTPKTGSMGRPVPLYDVEIVNENGARTEIGEIGEIVIRTDRENAPCGLFRGYFGEEDKTLAAWHDGSYHTGDTAWRDEDGYYWYVGRVDDQIKSSGYRIGPFEIESVIMELPYVLECGVSAAPDEIRGQVVKASIVLLPGVTGTEEMKREIQQYVKSHTAPYKYPRIVVFRDDLPKTTSGKIIRNLL